MGEECCVVPPGFRFHPTEEELVGYYLARKVASRKIDLDIIQEVDLYSMEPWDLQRSAIVMCNRQQQQQYIKQLGGGECYYFFSHKDRKYPSGTRTNRATAAGFWKATGRDKPVLSSSSRSPSRGGGGGGGGRFVIGMRKTLVFYKGRAPNGRKTEWIMHEYRLHHQSNNHHLPPQEEGWVVCRAFQKPIPNQQQQQQRPPFLLYHHPSGYGDHHFSGSTSSSLMLPLYYPAERKQQIFPQLQLQQLSNTYNYNNDDDIFVESKNKQQHLLSSIINIPQLIESPLCPAAAVDDAELLLIQHQQGGGGGGGGQAEAEAEAEAAAAGAAIDWNFLDTLLLSASTDGFAAPPYDPLSSS